MLMVTLLLVAGSAPADAQRVPVEDWTQHAVGAAGIPAGWQKYETIGGRPGYDFAIVDDEGRRALRLRSGNDHSTIVRPVRVDLRATPILEWQWKVVKLPDGADIRRKETSDAAGHVFVVWPRTPALLRTRLLGYLWDPVTPAPSVDRSRKTSLVAFFVVRSGSALLNRWIVERRNVYEDYVKAFGEPPDAPGAVAISIDTNDTHATAETLIGPIAFTADGRVEASGSRAAYGLGGSTTTVRSAPR